MIELEEATHGQSDARFQPSSRVMSSKRPASSHTIQVVVSDESILLISFDTEN